MARRATPQRITDDSAFPVRVKVRIPSGGFRRLDGAIREWLDREVGRTHYARHPAQGLGEVTSALYFRDVGSAARFFRALPELVLADGTVGAACTAGELPFGRK